MKIQLSKICDLQNGYAFKSSDYVEESNTLSCRMSNIRLGGIFDIQYNARYLPDAFAETYNNFLLHDGDLVIAMTDLANDPKLLGIPTIVKTEGKNILLNQRVGKLIIKDKSTVDNKYLQYALNHPDARDFYKKFASGGLQINLSKQDLLKVEIPLPPLEEQRRIVEILDKADTLIQKRKAAIEKLDELLQATFIDMFGDPVTNPKGWDLGVWQNILEIKNGRSQKNVINPQGKYPICGSGGIMGYADDWITPSGSVIIGRKGNINKPILMHENFWNVDTAFGLVPNSKLLVKDYLYWFCEFYDFEKHNKTVTIPSLTKSDLLQIKMPLPPIDQQNIFTIFCTKTDQQKQKMQAQLEMQETLFKSLQQQAFSGQL